MKISNIGSNLSRRVRLGLAVFAGLVAFAGIAYAAPTSVRLTRWFFKGGITVGKDATANAITKSLGGSATIDFTPAYSGVYWSSGITVTGAAAGDPCKVGVPTAAAALRAKFGCEVTAADTVKVWFSPEDAQDGTAALASASPSVVTVDAGLTGNGAICDCDPVGATAAIAAAGCATGITYPLLTMTGPNTVTTVMSYHCASPVDPASGTYYVRVTSSQ